jgi:hypothetical protein
MNRVVEADIDLCGPDLPDLRLAHRDRSSREHHQSLETTARSRH